VSLLAELRRRNVIRVAAAYVVLSWLILQMGDLLFDLMALPDWANRIVLVILVLGFPVAVILSWVFELTPEGVRRESQVDRSRSITRETGRRLDYVTLAALALVVALVIVDRQTRPAREAPAPAAASASSFDSPVEPASASVPNRPDEDRPGTSIAVLPFANLSPDTENEYFADGVAEEILNLIAKAPDLRVISRSSAFSFKGQNLSIPEIAERLDVNHVLEGSVRRAGNRVRITAQLIAVESDAHLWSETFDRTLTDIFAVQDEIAGAIADALQVELGVASSEIAASEEDAVAAYERVMQARARLARRTIPGINQAIDLFTEAVALAPGYAEAQGQLAMAHVLRYEWETRADVDLDAVRRNAQAALISDADNVAALTALASYHLYALEFERAEATFLQALAVNPNSVQANNWYGDFLIIVQRGEEAVRHEKRAADLDPLLAVHRLNLGWAYWINGQMDAALDAFEAMIRLDPGIDMLGQHPRLLAILGRTDRLEAALQRETQPEPFAEFLRHIARRRFDAALAMVDDAYEAKAVELTDSGHMSLRAGLLCLAQAFDACAEVLEGLPNFRVSVYWIPFEFPTEPGILAAHPRYAAFWRSPPRDRLLKARGHWVEEGP